MSKFLVTAAFVTLSAAGCATAGDGGSASSSSGDVITTAELREIEGQGLSAYEAVRRLRSNWLRARGSSFSGERALPVVFVNGTRYGEVDALYSLTVEAIERMEFLDARDATTQFGTGYIGGAILVTTF